MAEYILRNSLNPDKVVKCSITFRKLTNKLDRGEPIWLVQIATTEPHKDGGKIAPVFINLAILDNLDLEVADATEAIAAQVDWGSLRADTRPPIVSIFSPDGDLSNVDIMSDLVFDLRDLLPTSGIDKDSITASVNGVDVTSELAITGDPWGYNVIWKPFKRVLDNY